jgi:carnitine O-acetyltransferase
MESYQWMFNACRIPARPAYHPVKYDPKEHKHFVVVRKNQFFKVMHEVGGQQLNTSELEQQFKRTYEKAERVPAVGILTTEYRDIWTDARKKLLEAHASNATALKTIESASFVMCLDDAAPVTLEERAHQYWHGDGANRWSTNPFNPLSMTMAHPALWASTV